MLRYKSKRFVFMAAALALMSAVAACAKKPPPTTGAGTAAPGSVQEFATSVGDRVFFAVDSSQISPSAAQILDRQAAWLGRYPNYTVTVEGHADERGTREYNIALSARRANATKTYLESRGVPGSRLRTISFGKERPVAACEAESCWSQNRRAVTVLGGS